MRTRRNKNYFLHLILQGLAAIIFMFVVLVSLDWVGAKNLIWAAGASCLAASSFLVFATPNAEYAKARHIIFGYVIAILCGHLVRIFTLHLCHNDWGDCQYRILVEVAAIISLGITFCIMVLSRSGHPPAAGLAIVMVLEISNYAVIGIILAAAVVLAAIHFLFNFRMRPLI